ncbi:MAG: hypothetical protein R2941_22150 [Desulfobacterales bacterium]
MKFVYLLRTMLILCFLALVPVLLFAVNGLLLAGNEHIVTGLTQRPAVHPAREENGAIRLKLMSWNVAKLFVHNGGLSFDPPEKVRAQRRLYNIIRAESRILFSCVRL